MKLKRGFVPWLVALLIATQPISAYSAEDPLLFGIVPQESSSKLADQWTPLMRYLSEQLGRQVRFTTAPDIPTFEERVLAGQYDIAYMNPYHYVEFSESPGYQAVAREGEKRIRGIIVVGEDSPVTTLEELEGSTLAFPAPAAFAATILTRAELERLGVTYTPRFVSSHESVYLNVQKGFAAAGGGIERTYNSAIAGGLTGVRVLWRSEGYTPHAIAVHPKHTDDQRLRIQAALTNLGSSEEGVALLQRANLKTLVPAGNHDWDDVRGLGLDFIQKTDDP
ncbi:phosphate/phosphite/phosphonate ABC transporter substrate-binding protein [uncultured Marinobacter sp.]|uniref:phosphate/phosphite/phosphonate ABC transporter substrate-binding protein n=1 Tax=uncultured Marinobacter sp. TaxID=187379 RepID=UPI0025F163A3|nr:phosphate/phosphite/phosphonate ABC transporter substrate-binding protein [uncultured Marinobacter sp.]